MMSWDNLEKISFVLLLVAVTVMNVYVYNNQTKLMEDIYSMEVSGQLYNPNNANHFTSGVYYATENYYCVKTYDRDLADIKMTESHELAHAFVDMDYNHFCLYKNQTSWDLKK